MASKKMKSFTPCIHIIHFINGYKRTIPNVICVWENEAVHLLTLEGGEWIIYKDKVLCVEKIRGLETEIKKNE